MDLWDFSGMQKLDTPHAFHRCLHPPPMLHIPQMPPSNPNIELTRICFVLHTAGVRPSHGNGNSVTSVQSLFYCNAAVSYSSLIRWQRRHCKCAAHIETYRRQYRGPGAGSTAAHFESVWLWFSGSFRCTEYRAVQQCSVQQYIWDLDHPASGL